MYHICKVKADSIVMAVLFDLSLRQVATIVGDDVMSTHASILVDSVGPSSAEVCRTAASFP
jgi:hypothetical protein